MAITVCENCIDFGSQSLCVDPAGIYVSGRFDLKGFGSPPPQGSVSGYVSGGYLPGTGRLDTIQKFPFSSDTNATDVAELTAGVYGPSSASSPVSGYSAGGTIPAEVTTIEKFPFSSDSNATDIAELSLHVNRGNGNQSGSDGYTTGGDSPAAPAGVGSKFIQKYPFQSDAPASNIGDMSACRFLHSSQSSNENGYSSGGRGVGGDLESFEKFSFASGVATDLAEFGVPNGSPSPAIGCILGGQESETHGYISGGQSPAAIVNIIQKFSFAAEASTTDVGNLTICFKNTTGQSSTTDGYASGGFSVPGGAYPSGSSVKRTIQKFPYASDTNSSPVGILVNGMFSGGGHQV